MTFTQFIKESAENVDTTKKASDAWLESVFGQSNTSPVECLDYLIIHFASQLSKESDVTNRKYNQVVNGVLKEISNLDDYLKTAKKNLELYK